ncbi:MAG: flavin reductase family protein [Rhodocyclales bacterium]|nr:flavin reductase family protein [Rhodocyclales bacterium]
MPPQMNLDPIALRAALGQYATGVAVVTTVEPDGNPVGLTINSFASVSLAPPLVLWSLGLASNCLSAFQNCSHFAITVLAADQVEISNRFASVAAQHRFTGLAWTPGLGGAPVLDGGCAVFECRNEARHAGGDHLILVGRVERFSRSEKPPLLFHGGRYRGCADLP